MRPIGMRRLLAALPLAALALAACGDGVSVGTDPSPSPTPASGAYAANEIVLRIVTSGGLVPQEYAFSQLPEVAIYGDGRVFSVGAQPAIFPGAALPPLLVTRIEPSRLPGLVADAKAAGVDGEQRDYGQPRITDVGTTTFWANDGAQTYQTSVYALGVDGAGSDGITTEQAAARTKLRELRDELTALGDAGDAAFEPTSVAVWARAYQRPEEAHLAQQPKAWPGPDPATGTTFASGRCFVVTGADLATALPEIRKANGLTPWTFAGQTYAMSFRPMLPDETACIPDYS